MRWFLLSFFLLCLVWVGLFGWQGQVSTNRPVEVFQDMDHQYKVGFQQPSDFFADGHASRKPVAGTIAMGWEVPHSPSPRDGSSLPDSYYNSGRFGEFYGDGMPKSVEVSEALLARGQQRFNIYCAVCHGESGNGKGVVANHWMGGMLPPTANLIDPRVVAMPDGQIFWTITNGKGLMGPYSGNVSVPDRWAIVAYMRALQDSQGADPKDPKVKELLEAGEQEPAQEASVQPETAGAEATS